MVGGSTTNARSTASSEGVTLHDPQQQDSAARPRLVDGAIADVLVRVRGGAVCSGTPITGTVYVVTAAHCVLDRRGHAAARTVVRDGGTYTASAVYVDERYFDEPTSQLDAAVLVMDEIVPGTAATIGAAVPSTGSITIAGFQPLDTDGTLLRGNATARPAPPQGRHRQSRRDRVGSDRLHRGGRVGVGDRQQREGPLRIDPWRVGGGMFAELDGKIVLVGIISTVSADLTANGVVPLESIHELVLHPEKYRHEVTAAAAPRRLSARSSCHDRPGTRGVGHRSAASYGSQRPVSKSYSLQVRVAWR